MKILCVSDHIDPLVYSAQAKERFRDIDLVVSAGDLPMEYLGFIASSLNRELLFVFGNHNLDEYQRFRQKRSPYESGFAPHPDIQNYYGSRHIHGKVVRTHKLLVAGLGGCMVYNGEENQFTDFQMYVKIIRLMPRLLLNKLIYGRFLDILLTHAPPRGIHDKPDPTHRGFASFLWFMRVFRPRYLLHGHIHLYDLNAKRVTVYHQTTVINVYDHYVLEVDSLNKNENQSNEQLH